MYLANLADFFTTIIDLNRGFVETNSNYGLLGPVPFFTVKLCLPLVIGLGFYPFCKGKNERIYTGMMIAVGLAFGYCALHNYYLLYHYS
jgi:hypothetical protein